MINSPDGDTASCHTVVFRTHPNTGTNTFRRCMCGSIFKVLGHCMFVYFRRSSFSYFLFMLGMYWWDMLTELLDCIKSYFQLNKSRLLIDSLLKTEIFLFSVRWLPMVTTHKSGIDLFGLDCTCVLHCYGTDEQIFIKKKVRKCCQSMNYV